ncbi:hypothetical protein Tcan_12107 [Toxocara canis]|uniref:Uncharacterized protein n=1 Tax=Toxocara canis TaxID=6265 RepID=A0A0B2UPQ4_TOXCA|nr:hypothetical protein Tcan_12107 [Toxocara canis]
MHKHLNAAEAPHALGTLYELIPDSTFQSRTRLQFAIKSPRHRRDFLQIPNASVVQGERTGVRRATGFRTKTSRHTNTPQINRLHNERRVCNTLCHTLQQPLIQPL